MNKQKTHPAILAIYEEYKDSFKNIQWSMRPGKNTMFKMWNAIKEACEQ